MQESNGSSKIYEVLLIVSQFLWVKTAFKKKKLTDPTLQKEPCYEKKFPSTNLQDFYMYTSLKKLTICL